MSRAEIKADAKRKLDGKYGDAIKMMLIYFVISLGTGLFLLMFFEGDSYDMVSTILSLVISGLFGLGYKSFFLKISRGEEVSYNELFKKTDLFLVYLGVSLLVGLFTLFWSFLFIIPGIIASISYIMVFYIAIDNPDMGVLDIIKKSKEMMKGHKWEYFVLTLSFIGWEILNVFTLGILSLWLVPYMEVTYANFYNKIKG